MTKDALRILEDDPQCFSKQEDSSCWSCNGFDVGICAVFKCVRILFAKGSNGWSVRRSWLSKQLEAVPSDGAAFISTSITFENSMHYSQSHIDGWLMSGGRAPHRWTTPEDYGPQHDGLTSRPAMKNVSISARGNIGIMFHSCRLGRYIVSPMRDSLLHPSARSYLQGTITMPTVPGTCVLVWFLKLLKEVIQNFKSSQEEELI